MTLPKEPFTIDLSVLFETILHLLSKGKSLTKFHIAKMIYFADREHLFNYGKPITGDSYYAMQHGPVPSKTYDILKVVSGEENLFLDESVQGKAYEILGSDDGGASFFPKRTPDRDYLSPSAIECLDGAFSHVYGKTFGVISDETHKHSGYKDLDPNDMMSFWNIIKDADNYDELKEYLQDTLQGNYH